MKHNLVATCIISLAFSCDGNAQGVAFPPQDSPHYTHAQVKQLVRDAHTPDQYKTLASYYDAQQKSYLQQAADEKREWDRRSQNAVGVAAKYPRPVDSARNLYEYYMYKASEAGSLTAKYAQLSVPSAPEKLQ
jgi:hypothetical protein